MKPPDEQERIESLEGEVRALRAILIAVARTALSEPPDYTGSRALRETLKDRARLVKPHREGLSESATTEFCYHVGEILDSLSPYIEQDR